MIGILDDKDFEHILYKEMEEIKSHYLIKTEYFEGTKLNELLNKKMISFYKKLDVCFAIFLYLDLILVFDLDARYYIIFFQPMLIIIAFKLEIFLIIKIGMYNLLKKLPKSDIKNYKRIICFFNGLRITWIRKIPLQEKIDHKKYLQRSFNFYFKFRFLDFLSDALISHVFDNVENSTRICSNVNCNKTLFFHHFKQQFLKLKISMSVERLSICGINFYEKIKLCKMWLNPYVGLFCCDCFPYICDFLKKKKKGEKIDRIDSKIYKG